MLKVSTLIDVQELNDNYIKNRSKVTALLQQYSWDIFDSISSISAQSTYISIDLEVITLSVPST